MAKIAHPHTKKRQTNSTFFFLLIQKSQRKYVQAKVCNYNGCARTVQVRISVTIILHIISVHRVKAVGLLVYSGSWRNHPVAKPTEKEPSQISLPEFFRPSGQDALTGDEAFCFPQ